MKCDGSTTHKKTASCTKIPQFKRPALVPLFRSLSRSMPAMPMVAYKSFLECDVLSSTYVEHRQGQIIFKMKKEIKEKQALGKQTQPSDHGSAPNILLAGGNKSE